MGIDNFPLKSDLSESFAVAAGAQTMSFTESCNRRILLAKIAILSFPLMLAAMVFIVLAGNAQTLSPSGEVDRVRVPAVSVCATVNGPCAG